MGITFYNNSTNLKIKNKLVLKKWLLSALAEYKTAKKINVNIAFCSDDEILKINIDFLNHNYYTDILTFNLSEKTDVLDADIFISYETVMYNSNKYSVSFNNEMCRVLIHGILHLIGFNDKKPKEKKQMTAEENQKLEDLFHVKHIDFFTCVVSRETQNARKQI